MTPSARQLEALLERAEQTAATFDAAAMAPVIEALRQAADTLPQQKMTPTELEHARARLMRYRDLCAFYHNTLHRALLAASQNGTPGYAPPGQDHPPSSRPLIERYG